MTFSMAPIWGHGVGASRARLVREAGEVFYREGINATGVARSAAQLQISKRTLYKIFETKDALVAATLQARDLPMREAFIASAEAAGHDPVDQLIGLFTGVEPWLAAPDFRGCPFLNATAELSDPARPARTAARVHKEGLRLWMEQRARAAGLRSPEAVSHQLMLVFDGSMSQAALAPLKSGQAAAAAHAVIAAAR